MTALTQKASGRVWLLLLAVVAVAALLFTALLPAGANEIEPITVRNIDGDACRSTDLEDFGVEPFSVDAFSVPIPRGGNNSPVFSQTLDVPGGGTIEVTSPSNRKYVEFEANGVEVQGAIYFNRNNQKLGNLYDYRPLPVSSGTIFPPPKDSGQAKQVVFCFNSKADPTVSLSTTGAIVGGTVDASAVVANGDTFEGSSVLTFSLHQNSCDGTQIGSSQDKPINNGTIDADAITVSAAGTYYWKATFLGDANNNAASDCESVTVSKATPTITVTTTGAAVGADVKASAAVSGGVGYTGATELVFTLHAGTTCAGSPIAGPDGQTMVNGTINASDVTSTSAGTFSWKASFAGDANNNAASDCQTVTVSTATPTVTVAADETDVVTGTAISAKATLAAGFSPTGTITFALFSTETCTGDPVATANATAAVNGNGMYASMDVTDALPFGTYYWKATYGGDTNNDGNSDCGAAVQIYQQGVDCLESGFEAGDDGLIALGVAFERGFDLIDGKDSCDVGEIPVTLEISETEVTFDFPTNATYPGARFMVRIDWNPAFPTVDPFNPPDRQVAYDVNGSYVTGEACTGTNAPPGVVPTPAFVYNHPVDTPVCLAGEQLLLTPDGWQQIQFWDVLYDPKWKF